MMKTVIYMIAFWFSYNVIAASTNINMTANIISTSCRVTLDNNGNIDLGTVDYSYLNNNTSVDRVYSGGHPFYITVSDCAQVAGKNPAHLTVSFTPLQAPLRQPTSRYSPTSRSTVQKMSAWLFYRPRTHSIFSMCSTRVVNRKVFTP